jgi:hypothetical protein
MNSELAFAGRHGPLLLFFGVLIGSMSPALAAAAKPWMGASVFVFTLGAFLKVDGNAFRVELRRPLQAAAVHRHAPFGHARGAEARSFIP